MTLLIAEDPHSGTPQAHTSLGAELGATTVWFDPPPPEDDTKPSGDTQRSNNEMRRVHAKLILVQSKEWIAALIGSSNATEQGLGLARSGGHSEVNIWIGCPINSPNGKQLKALASAGEEFSLDDYECTPGEDEDDQKPLTPQLPPMFQCCLLDAANQYLELHLDQLKSPADWSISLPNKATILTAKQWIAAGKKPMTELPLGDEAFPTLVHVEWTCDGEKLANTLTVNVKDKTNLPPSSDGSERSAEELLNALASGWPLHIAIARGAPAQQGSANETNDIESDPLRRFDEERLLHRTRRMSRALFQMQNRLSRPFSAKETLHWRLYGTFGPVTIAKLLSKSDDKIRRLPGESRFIIAELALTIGAVDWETANQCMKYETVRSRINGALDDIAKLLPDLQDTTNQSLDSYVAAAIEEAYI